jgi:hypothetical protein
MSGGRLFNKSGLRLIPPDHAVRAAEEGGSVDGGVWRVPMRRVDLEGVIPEDSEVPERVLGGHGADVAMLPPAGLWRGRTGKASSQVGGLIHWESKVARLRGSAELLPPSAARRLKTGGVGGLASRQYQAAQGKEDPARVDWYREPGEEEGVRYEADLPVVDAGDSGPGKGSTSRRGVVSIRPVDEGDAVEAPKYDGAVDGKVPGSELRPDEKDLGTISKTYVQPVEEKMVKGRPVEGGQVVPEADRPASVESAPAPARVPVPPPLGPRPRIRKGKRVTSEEAQAVRAWVWEDLKLNYPGLMKLPIQKRQKVYDDALAQIWSADDQRSYDTRSFKGEKVNAALDGGDYQKLRVRAEALVKSAPGYADFAGDDRMKAIEAVALSLGKMTKEDFERAMVQRNADERGFWATVGGSAWGTLARTAGSAVKIGERAYSRGDPSYDTSKGYGEQLKNWGNEFETLSGDDTRKGARLVGRSIGATAPYLLAAPALGVAGLSQGGVQFTLGAAGAAHAGSDAYDWGVANGLEGKELAKYVAGHAGLGAATALIGVKGAAPGSSVTGTLLSKALPQTAGAVRRAGVGVVGRGGQRALEKVAGATADGVVLGAGANVGSNALEKAFIDPDVGLWDNMAEAALSGGLSGAMGGISHAAQTAAAKFLKSRYFNGKEPPKIKSREAQNLTPAERVAMHVLARRRGLAQVTGDASKPVVKKGLERGKEAVGKATRRSDEFVEEVRENLERLIEQALGGGPRVAMAGADVEAPHGRTSSGRPRMDIRGFLVDANDAQMAGRGGDTGDGLPRDADGKLGLEGNTDGSVSGDKTIDSPTPRATSTSNAKLSAEEYLGPYLEKVKQIYAADPVFMPNLGTTNFEAVTGGVLKKIRLDFTRSRLRGHHRHPIAHGGPAIPTEPGGLVFTGESQIPAKQLDGMDLSFYTAKYGKSGAKVLKIHQPEPAEVFRFGPNPRHTKATNLWNEIERWQRESGVR